MTQPTTAEGKITLPLVSSEHNDTPAPEWQGWRPLSPLPEPVDAEAPEPLEPQGEYNPQGADTPLQLPEIAGPEAAPVELLAPAGGPEAAFAAFHFGADAIYLGLKKFSARAEAENFSLAEVDEITAYAHSLQPRRRVFVTINTLVRQDELAELVEDVAALAEIGVDALIIQDLGVYHLVRQHFPQLELHASTQLAVHNQAGAETLRRLGFARVVLARELTFEEVHDITAAAGIETEVFIHGALCYSYSGLCLFSSQTLGRSGNRGKCAYSCRHSFEVSGAPLTLRDGSPVQRDPRQGFPFSMKDLALPDHMPALRAAGVSCFKIEGRKKSHLYVATTTDYYRRLLDGKLADEERPILESDMQTVFSRPWTRLFVQSHKDKEVADRDTVGHRGTNIGTVAAILEAGTNRARLRFRSSRSLQKHDGLQVDLPVLSKPFGFAVDQLWVINPGRKEKRQEAMAAAPGTLVEVSLPADHPPLPVGAPVYCSSSQAVKQRYRHERPKAGQYRIRVPIQVHIELTEQQLRVQGRIVRAGSSLPVEVTLAGPFAAAKNPDQMPEVLRGTFAKLGQTSFVLEEITCRNPAGLFVPVSRLNPVRRELADRLEQALQQARQQRVQTVKTLVLSPPPPLPQGARGEKNASGALFRWSLKVDRIGALAALEPADLADIAEITIDIARDQPTILLERLSELAQQVGQDRLRLALPPLIRRWEDKSIRYKMQKLREAGWQRWEAANLSAWSYLGLDPLSPPANLDLTADWSLYVINRLAARQLLEMGVRRFTLSPEDGLANLRSLLTEFADQATLIVYQDTPQFLAESCAYANLIGGCPGKANCRFESMEMVSSHGEKVTALDYHCRTIVLNQGPFCLSTRLKDLAKAGAKHLRADFIYRKYEPEQLRELWRRIRSGQPVPQGQAANFDRGLL